MYKLIAFLLLLIAALQYRLWLGDGGILEYRETSQRIEEMKQEGEKRRLRNEAIAADVKDLKTGSEAIEQRARHDMGMVKAGETFIQVYDSVASPLPSSTSGKSRPLSGSAAGKHPDNGH